MNASALSSLLLDLYRYSRELPLGEFQGQALARLQQDLSFDAAWWGVAHPSHDIHGSFPYKLPADYANFYLERVQDTDSLAEAGLSSPGQTVCFGPAQFATSPGLSLLTEHFAIQQALCTVLDTPTLNLSMFISLYRTRREPAFLESERQFCDCVAPHLWATWTSNWIIQMEHIRADSAATRISHAIVDQRAVLHSAEPRFVKLMHAEWPQWRGPALPPTARRSLQASRGYRGRSIALRSYQSSGLMLLEARAPSALDSLSPREKTIAAAFGEGRSYKQIAASLGLSPATVRHHLRRVYSKANISNKSELTSLIK